MNVDTPALHVGGTIPTGSLYVERSADRDLPDRLSRGEFCSVLAPRQMGKSSLRVRAEATLRARDIQCATVDLNLVGTKVTADEWYFGVVELISAGLGLEADPLLFWNKSLHLSLVQRFVRYLENEVLRLTTRPVVIFVDEIDNLLTLDFRDDFFAAIRATWNQRADAEAWKRITFCLLGVAAPNDLISDPKHTPFNIGTAVALEDFTRAETRAFAGALAKIGSDSAALVDEVFKWTDGNPYMTTRVCSELQHRWMNRQTPDSTDAVLTGDVVADVESVVRELFLQHGRTADANLGSAERRILEDARPGFTNKMLQIYEQILTGDVVVAGRDDPYHVALRLSGMVADRHEKDERILRVRNRIFAKVFNLSWVRGCKVDRQLGDAVSRWLVSGKSDDLVLRGAVLTEALLWAQGSNDVSLDEWAFLNAGQHSARREEQLARARERSLRLFLIVASAVLAVVLWFALVQWRMASTERGKAQEEQRKATAAAEAERLARADAEVKTARALAAEQEAQRLAAAASDGARVATDHATIAQNKAARTLKEASDQTISSELRIGNLVTALEQQRKVAAEVSGVNVQLQSEVDGLRAAQTKLGGDVSGVKAELAKCRAILAGRGQ